MSTQPRTVLLGEHSPAVARELAGAFVQAGYHIIGNCTDGLSLVAAAREHKPTILCLDIILPRLSGLQVLEALGDHGSIVVISTAVSSRGRVAEAKRLGVSVYMLKPVQHDRLVSAIVALNPDQMRSAS